MAPHRSATTKGSDAWDTLALVASRTEGWTLGLPPSMGGAGGRFMGAAGGTVVPGNVTAAGVATLGRRGNGCRMTK